MTPYMMVHSCIHKNILALFLSLGSFVSWYIGYLGLATASFRSTDRYKLWCDSMGGWSGSAAYSGVSICLNFLRHNLEKSSWTMHVFTNLTAGVVTWHGQWPYEYGQTANCHPLQQIARILIYIDRLCSLRRKAMVLTNRKTLVLETKPYKDRYRAQWSIPWEVNAILTRILWPIIVYQHGP